MRRPRPARLVAVTALLGTLVIPATAAFSTPERVLPEAANGEEAIRALGSRLPEVAAAHDRSPAELRADFREDSALWIDPTARLFYVDPPRPAGPSPTTADAVTATSEVTTPPPASEAFTLHSKPGAQRVIHLDFNGHWVQDTGWNGGQYGGPRDGWEAVPYDTDGSPSSFSDAERAVVASVWQRVAEDYAGVDVDVTTADPGEDAIARTGLGDQQYGTRVVISDTNEVYRKCGCGGIAYVGTYDIEASHSYYQPAWVFTQGVGDQPHNIAEAASHEAGHNLGLSHDGTSSTGYYTGQGGWAPIMGVGYYEPITQWSKGEYAGANNDEDDHAVMAANGAPPMDDDHPSATDLTGSATGVIESPGDTDTFAFSVPDGASLDLRVLPASTSPNLDVHLTVHSATGSFIDDHDPISAAIDHDVATGMGAEILALPPGAYRATVDGVGRGDPRTDGYSDYGSIGHYTILLGTADDTGGGDGDGTGTDPDPDPTTPPAAPTGFAASSNADGTSVDLTWSDASDDEDGFEIQRESQHPKNLKWTGTTTLTAPANSESLVNTPGPGTHRYRLRSINTVGASTWSSWIEVTLADTDDGGSGGGGPGGGKGNGGGKKIPADGRIP